MVQPWFCEKCDKSGRVVYAQHDDVNKVIYRLRISHARVSPRCNQSVMQLRVMTKPKMLARKGK